MKRFIFIISFWISGISLAAPCDALAPPTKVEPAKTKRGAVGRGGQLNLPFSRPDRSNNRTSVDNQVKGFLDSLGLRLEEGRWIAHPMLKSRALEFTEYQVELAARASEKNSIVCLPTGTGKTPIAAVILARRFQENPDGRVLCLVPTVSLATQQAGFFNSKMNRHAVVLTGETPQKERVSIWGNSENNIIVATPELVAENIDVLDLGLIDFLIVDEAHHAVGNDATAVVSRRFLERKGPEAYFGPSVLGLTASAKSLIEDVEEIKLNLGTLDFDGIWIMTRDDPRVSRFIPPTIEHPPIKISPIKDRDENLMKVTFDMLGTLSKYKGLGRLTKEGFIKLRKRTMEAVGERAPRNVEENLKIVRAGLDSIGAYITEARQNLKGQPEMARPLLGQLIDCISLSIDMLKAGRPWEAPGKIGALEGRLSDMASRYKLDTRYSILIQSYFDYWREAESKEGLFQAFRFYLRRSVGLSGFVKGIVRKDLDELERDYKWLTQPNEEKILNAIRQRFAQTGDKGLLPLMTDIAVAFRIANLFDRWEREGAPAALKYIDSLREKESEESKKPQRLFLSDKRIRNVESGLKEIIAAGIEHQKFAVLLGLLIETRKKTIIFATHREVVNRIVKFLDRNGLKAERLVGRAQPDGMKRVEQQQVLERFRNDEFDILVTTSVGEEGLDIPKGERTFIFEPVPSELRETQRRGRFGRYPDLDIDLVGEIYVLITTGTLDEKNYEISQNKKRRMERLYKEYPEFGRLVLSRLGDVSLVNSLAIEFNQSLKGGGLSLEQKFAELNKFLKGPKGVGGVILTELARKTVLLGEEVSLQRAASLLTLIQVVPFERFLPFLDWEANLKSLLGIYMKRNIRILGGRERMEILNALIRDDESLAQHRDILEKIFLPCDEQGDKLALAHLEKIWAERVAAKGPVGPMKLTDLAEATGIPSDTLNILASLQGSAALLPFQNLAAEKGFFQALLDRDLVLMAPTTAGKTLLAELGALQYFYKKEEGPKKALFLLPTKALVSQMASDLQRKYSTSGLKIYASTADISLKDGDIITGNYDMAVIVYEKFKTFLNHNPDFLKEVGLVVIDEVGMLKEPSRGRELEIYLALIKSSPNRPRILCLSAPLAGIEELAQYLEGKLISTDLRPIPLCEGLYWKGIYYSRTTDRTYERGEMDEESMALKYPAPPKEFLKDLFFRFLYPEDMRGLPDEALRRKAGGLMVALPTKQDVSDYAGAMVELIEEDEDVKEAMGRLVSMSLVDETASNIKGKSQMEREILRALSHGIGIHQGDLSYEDRHMVEEVFRTRGIPIIFSTSTLAQGVNLPAKTMVFLNWGKSEFTKGLLTVEKYKNWVGRAGRMGYEEKGYSIYFADSEEEFERVKGFIVQEKGNFGTRLLDGSPLEDCILRSLRPGDEFTLNDVRRFFAETLSALKEKDKTAAEVEGALVNLVFPGMGTKASLPIALRMLELFSLLEDEMLTDKGAQLQERLSGLLVSIDSVDPILGNRIRDAHSQRDPERLSKEKVNHLKGILFNEAYAGLLKRFGDGKRRMKPIGISESGKFILTGLGEVCSTHGVSIETANAFSEWLIRKRERRADSLEVFYEALSVSESKDFTLLRTEATAAELLGHLNNYKEKEGGLSFPEIESVLSKRYLPPKEGDLAKRRLASILALKDWTTEAELEEIEAKYKISGSLSNLAGEVSRMIRVIEDSRKASGMEEFGVSLEGRPMVGGLSSLAHMVLYGLAPDAVGLAAANIELLSRAWILELKRQLDKFEIEPRLPLLERLQECSYEWLQEILTPRLAYNLTKALKEERLIPLADSIKAHPELVKAYYYLPGIAEGLINSLEGHYSPIQQTDDGKFLYPRRKDASKQILRFKTKEELLQWVDKGAVSFYKEIAPYDRPNQTEYYFIDIDPYNDYPKENVQNLARLIANRFAAEPNVERVEVEGSGGKSFYIKAHFKLGSLSLEGARENQKTILRNLLNRPDVLPQPDPLVVKPYVRIDFSVVKGRGYHRLIGAIHAGTGGICHRVGDITRSEPRGETFEQVLLSRLKEMGLRERDQYFAQLLPHLNEKEYEAFTGWLAEKGFGNIIPPRGADNLELEGVYL